MPPACWPIPSACTGTKGKSTTTALLAHLLRCAGHRTGLAGNIGLPLLEVLDPQPAPEYWAVELSSYQTGEVARAGVRPAVAIVLNIFPEHLDWHGSEQRYIDDKLALVTAGHPRIAVLNAADPHLQGLQLPHSQVVWFNQPEGWHMLGSVVYRGQQPVFDTATSPLPGAHNRGNLCAVLAAIEAMGLDAVAMAPAVQSFQPLPNRLQWLGQRDGVAWVNDSISTTPHASLAALECFAGQRIALLVGGHDRGLDWHDFARQVQRSRRWKSSPWAPMARASMPCCSRSPRGVLACMRPAILPRPWTWRARRWGDRVGWYCFLPGRRVLVPIRIMSPVAVILPSWPGLIRHGSARFPGWASADPGARPPCRHGGFQRACGVAITCSSAALNWARLNGFSR
jgi:UDP-N-acetylmuramoylalanine-D-glutamate ligase